MWLTKALNTSMFNYKAVEYFMMYYCRYIINDMNTDVFYLYFLLIIY